MANARASPARFRMPPDNSCGILPPAPSSATWLSKSSTNTFSSGSSNFLCMRRGNATFSKTEREPRSAAFWNTTPTPCATSHAHVRPSPADTGRLQPEFLRHRRPTSHTTHEAGCSFPNPSRPRSPRFLRGSSAEESTQTSVDRTRGANLSHKAFAHPCQPTLMA